MFERSETPSFTPLRGQQSTVTKPITPVAQTTTKLRVNCGCGYSAPSLSDAEAHAREYNHTVMFHGEIRPLRK